MNLFIDFIKTYWREILDVAVLVGSVVFFIVRKKPVKLIDSVKTVILAMLPTYIREAEIKYGAGHGEEKFAYVFKCIIDDFKKTQPDFDVQLYYGVIGQYIEDILSTPQKKGD